MRALKAWGAGATSLLCACNAILGIGSVESGSSDGRIADAGATPELTLTSGSTQHGVVGTSLAAPFVVTVMDAHGPVADVNVTFAVTRGAGALSTPSMLTDSTGQAQTTLTPGSSGRIDVQASATGPSGSPVTFTAFALGFATHVDVALGGGVTPYAIAAGDFNTDGLVDVAVADYGRGEVSVLLNTTAIGAAIPTFDGRMDFPSGPSGGSLEGTQSVAVGDFNLDGKPDLVVANSGDSLHGVSVLMNTTATGATAPSFAAEVSFNLNNAGNAVAVGDLNGDGKVDVACAVQSSERVFLNFTGVGASTPSFNGPFVIGNSVTGIEISTGIADMNGDGKPDVVVTTAASILGVILNNTFVGDVMPSFAAGDRYTPGSGPVALALSDLNGDGMTDIVVANSNSNTISIFFNTATIGATTSSLAPKVDLMVSNPESVVIADFDGDGLPDIAVTAFGEAKATVFVNMTSKGATSPSFATGVDFATGLGPQSIAVADVNGDGKPDLLTANLQASSFSTLLAQ